MSSNRALAALALAATFTAFALTTLVASATAFAIPARMRPAALENKSEMAAATAEPDAFELVLDGVRTSAGRRDLFSLGFRTEGPFTALGRFCADGQAVDLEYRLLVDWITGLRRLTCVDGTGEIRVRTWLLGMDEASGYEHGIWKIVGGTGSYEALRGIGTYGSVVLSGEPGDGVAARTLELWQGTAGFDRRAPRLVLSRVSFTKSAPTSCAYAVRVGFAARDGIRSARVSYHVSAWNRFLLAAEDGTTLSGTAAVVLHVQPGTGGRTIRLKVEASDQFGNDRRVVRTLRLPAPRKGC